jgi:hypothetical protein
MSGLSLRLSAPLFAEPSSFFLLFSFFFETGSCHVAQGALELVILLCQPQVHQKLYSLKF